VLPKPTKADAQLLLQFFQAIFGNENVMKAVRWTMDMPAVKSYEEFKEKYPPGSEGQMNIMLIGIYYELLGVLLYHKVLNEDLAFDLFRTARAICWDKAEPIVKGMQKDLKWPELLENYEWLAKRQSAWRKKHPAKFPESK